MQKESKFLNLVLLVVFVFFLMLLALWIFRTPQEEPTEELPATSTSSDNTAPSDDLFAIFSGGFPNNGFTKYDELARSLADGWVAFFQDESRYKTFLDTLEDAYEEIVSLEKEAGFSLVREVPGAFSWNLIEPVQGTYTFDLPDLAVTQTGEAGASLSAVIHPYAAWDSTEEPEGCEAIDFAFHDYKAGFPNDLEAYESFLRAVVDRYDGDGENDMPDLEHPVKYWEIANEIDGTCGGNLNQPEKYYELMKLSYEIIKDEDPDAFVLNAGALETDSNVTDIKGFWEEFFELGAGEYIDGFNLHYNKEKGGIASSSEAFEDNLGFFRDLLAEYEMDKPLWITEFGTFSGDVSIRSRDGRGDRDISQTPQEQAAWHMRYSIIAFEMGVEKIFIDLVGADGNTIGASSLFEDSGEPRLFLATLKEINETLVGFTSVKQLEEGQYLFEVDDHLVYALWDGELPREISGEVTVVNYAGERESVDATKIDFSAEEPVLVIMP